jgi:membrane-bound lytic murein transglycosylase B
MLSRRAVFAAPVLLAPGLLAPGLARAQEASFSAFLSGLRADARRQGVSDDTLQAALAGIHPNQKVLQLDRYQPEFTQTWAQYRAARVSTTRVANGRAAWQQMQPTLSAVSDRYGVEPGVVMGIWGLESNYGTTTGGFNVVEALATLAWDGRRASFFRPELITALKILDHHDISPGRMTGSYAGAMGQPQFMPSSYMRYAVDFEGNGRRDIWDSRPDSLASIANYLQHSGWRAGEPWGQEVRVPAGFGPTGGREDRRSLGEWMKLGVRREDGSPFGRSDVMGAVLLPDGPGGDAFMVYGNFGVIRRYNPSDFYALAVGLLGETVVA